MTRKSDPALSVLSPFWQRVARGEVDLSQYSDEEILKARLRMADGRLAPAPAVLPEKFKQEQVKRGFRVAEDKILAGSVAALDVYMEILQDDKAPRSERLKAAQFFTDRFLGKDVVKVAVASEDKIETLFRSILEDPEGLEEG